MGTWWGWIWECHEINSDMADYALLIEDISYRPTNCHHVHVWQTLLREETSSIYIGPSCKPIHWAHNLNLAIRLNQEWNTRTCHLVTQASRSSFNDATNSAEWGHILSPILKERWHTDRRFLGKVLCQYKFQLLDQVRIGIHLLFLQCLYWLD